jgi:hypothetical protein
MVGKTLAHYEVTGLLGREGMREVCRALDTRLERDVALKILPVEFARCLADSAVRSLTDTVNIEEIPGRME